MTREQFHEGERKIQDLTGESEKARTNGHMIKAEILTGAWNFISTQTTILLGTQSSDGKLWASLMTGPPGFLQVPQANKLRIDLTESLLAPGDPFLQNITDDPRIGSLLIDLESRRRLKINGKVLAFTKTLLEIQVEESFPLCPKYIQRRKTSWNRASINAVTPAISGSQFEKKEEEIIETCDTMFLVTGNPKGGLDVSHRGGEPGFVKLINQCQFRLPDYNGNGMYNTFGNLELNNNAGALFLDFEKGEALQINGFAQTLFNENDPNNETGGTSRFLTFTVSNWRRHRLPLSNSQFLDWSNFNPKRKNTN